MMQQRLRPWLLTATGRLIPHPHHHELHFLDSLLNILIVGRAKTGTTVISKSIEHSLWGKTQYWLEPKDPCAFFDESIDTKETHHVVKVLFEHWDKTPRMRNGFFHNETPMKFHRRVFIVRDPRDELVSRLLYIVKPWMDANGLDPDKNARWIDILLEKESDPRAMSFLQMARSFDAIYGTRLEKNIMNAEQFLPYSKYISDFKANHHVIRYEDFIAGDHSELASYLGVKLSDNRDVGNLSRTKRSASSNNWKQLFTEEDLVSFTPVYSPILDRLGYADWELSQTPTLKSEDYSGYISRLAGEHAVS